MSPILISMASRKPRYVKERPPALSVESAWRLFISVPLPPEVTTLVGEVVRDLSTEGWPVRWVAPDTAHITLQFIGEVPPERAEFLRLALPPVVARHTAFNLRTADLGVFPNQRRPRVLWLGLYGPAHRLASLRDDITDLLRQFEFPLDDKEFHPHVTLGRVRDVRDGSGRDLPARIQRRFAEEAASGRVTSKAPIPVPVQEVHLVRSFLEREGARHEPIARCPLGAPVAKPPRDDG